MPDKKIASQKLRLSKASNYIHHIIKVLAALFFVIWIIIGLFFLLTIYQGIKQGSFSPLSGSNNQGQIQQPSVAPTESDIPGIGRVNIACVQESVSQDSIVKVLEEQDINVLDSEERENFEACIVDSEDDS